MALISIARQPESRTIGWLILLVVTTAISISHAVEPYSDPEGLIRFSIPDAWTLQSESRGMRFRRAAGEERTVLSVYPRSQADGFDLEKLRTTRLSQVRSQSREVVTDTEYTLDQFRVWELLVRPGPDGRGPASHSLHLLNGNLHIEIMLIATPDRYPAYVDDLRAVAESVRTTKDPDAAIESSADRAASLTTSVKVETFEAPQGIEFAQPVYPKSKQTVGAEGWVNISLMVDAAGNPYEVTVSDSTGVEAFERAAVRAIEKSKFQPATLNGQTIDAGHHLKVKFELEGGSPGSRQRFSRIYQSLNSAIKNRDREKAEEHLDELTALSVYNLYEDAYLNLGRYTYYQLWGTQEQQLNALKRAIAHESKGGYLPTELFTSAMLTLFRLEVALQDFGGAMNTWSKLRALNLDADQLAKGQAVIDQLVALKEDERTYSVTGTIGPSASWFYTLFKRNFTIDVMEGELAELKIRCDKNYAFSRYDRNLVYRIAASDGDCHLEVVGNPGTLLTLTQS